MALIEVKERESLESALRRFRKRVQREKIIKEVKRHSYYTKPGDRRRAKRELARKRRKKKEYRQRYRGL